jgi:hypothetical protein
MNDARRTARLTLFRLAREMREERVRSLVSDADRYGFRLVGRATRGWMIENRIRRIREAVEPLTDWHGEDGAYAPWLVGDDFDRARFRSGHPVHEIEKAVAELQALLLPARLAWLRRRLRFLSPRWRRINREAAARLAHA